MFKPQEYAVSDKVMAERKELDLFLSDKNSLNDYFIASIRKHARLKAVTDTYSGIEQTYQQLLYDIFSFAAGLQSLGVGKGDFVALFSENNGRFQAVNQAILSCGGVSVLRGANAPLSELEYIIDHTDLKYLVVQTDSTLQKIMPALEKKRPEFVVVMFKKSDFSNCPYPVYSFDDVINMGHNFNFVKPKQKLDDPCTMFFTSGTTGFPKGVLLTHRNIASQFPSVDYGFLSQPGENTLQILPVWHAYEYTAQIYYFLCGCHLHFSTLSGLKNDFVRYRIDTFMSVPRIWESVRAGIYGALKKRSPFLHSVFSFAIKWSVKYKRHMMYVERRITNMRKKYRILPTLYHATVGALMWPLHAIVTRTLYKKLKNMVGLNFRASISGGGVLSAQDAAFYDAIGLNVRIGYGLTETSPVVTLSGVKDKNYLGGVGKAIKATEVKVVNPETFAELPVFQKGLILVRGPQVMKGYYKNKDATDAVLSKDGWFNTGDLGWLTYEENLVIVGRAKDTIVLSSGENVEPTPIEDACLGSECIDQIMIVGQDERNLGALVVPSSDALKRCGIDGTCCDTNDPNCPTYKNADLDTLIRNEIEIYIKNKSNLRAFEKIQQIAVIKECFTVDNGLLGQSFKMKRDKILEKYHDLVKRMFGDK